MSVSVLQAGQVFPNIELNEYSGDTIKLAIPNKGFDWRLIVVYRGKHCPLCTKYLQDLNRAVPEFNQLGVDVVAISADPIERVTLQMSEVSPNFDIGYGLTIEQMKILGLYISEPRLGMQVEHPFAEPGLFVVNEEGNLQMIDISNVPFARPPIESMLMGIKYYRSLTEKFPINGTYA